MNVNKTKSVRLAAVHSTTLSLLHFSHMIIIMKTHLFIKCVPVPRAGG